MTKREMQRECERNGINYFGLTKEEMAKALEETKTAREMSSSDLFNYLVANGLA